MTSAAGTGGEEATHAATRLRLHAPADVVLTDGGTVRVRAIEPSDGELLKAFHDRLSPESVYLRFFSPKPHLTPAEVARFTNVDHRDREALVAVFGDDIVAVARYDRWPGRDEAEAAFVVDDKHQGRGISTILLEHLAALARQRGIGRFTAEVLPQNRAMLGVFAAVGFAIERTFEGGVVDVVLDLEHSATITDTIEAREQRAESRSIARLLSARTIAVVGASSHAGTVGHEIFRLLLARGFAGVVYPVNPSAPEVAGVRTRASVGDIDDVELAIVAVPASSVRRAVEECVAKRVRGVIVVSEGVPADERRELVDYARRHGVRLLGPASMGLVRVEPQSTLHATFAAVPVTGGPIGISSQSGPLGLAMLDQAARLGLGVSTFVSLGDKGDLSGNDFLQFWFDDPYTEVVLMYTESFGNPRKFARVARRFSRRKPIVAVKVGDHAQDHARALYEQAGVIRVATVGEMFDTGRVLATQPRPRGPRLTIVTNAMSPAVLARAGYAAAGLVDGGVVGLGHRAGADDFAAALDALLAAGDTDAVLVIDAPPLLRSIDAVAAAVEASATRYAGTKPVVAVSLGRDAGPLAPGGRVPAFAFPEAAVAALGRAWRYESWRRRDEGQVPTFADVDLERIEAIIATALAARPTGTLLSLAAAGALLDATGVPFAPARAVATRGELLEAADQLGYPVALKALGLSRPARSESSGVALDLQSRAEVDAAFERMSVALGASAVAELCVQKMVAGGVETRVILEADATFGPVVGFGLGGAFADVIDDYSSRAVPLTDVDLRELVASSRAASVIGRPDAVIDVLARVSALAESVPEIVRLDLNPVLVSGEGACAVGVTVRVAPAEAEPPFPVRAL